MTGRRVWRTWVLLAVVVVFGLWVSWRASVYFHAALHKYGWVDP